MPVHAPLGQRSAANKESTRVAMEACTSTRSAALCHPTVHGGVGICVSTDATQLGPHLRYGCGGVCGDVAPSATPHGAPCAAGPARSSKPVGERHRAPRRTFQKRCLRGTYSSRRRFGGGFDTARRRSATDAAACRAGSSARLARANDAAPALSPDPALRACAGTGLMRTSLGALANMVVTTRQNCRWRKDNKVT